ncbi:MAG: glycosyltransferase family 39 protein [Elusimicrobia bacterium]|nr:glycosyltransferase family 39 protein [Elusimicrobiota bacterium]
MSKKKKNKNLKKYKQKYEIREHLPYPVWLVWGVVLIWGFIVLKNYYSKFLPDLDSLFTILSPAQYYIGNIKAFLGHFINLALSLLFVFAHFSLGRTALNFFNLKYNSALEETVFSIGAGFGIFANYIFLISALGALSLTAVEIPLACLIFYGFFDIRKKPIASFNILPEKTNFLDFIAFAILLSAVIFNLIGALSPEVFYDALVYHLAVPNYYIISGGMIDMPYNIYSNLPMLHGMLYAAGLLVKDEFIPKFINYFAGVLTVLTIIAISARYFSRRIGIWAALIFYTITQVMTASWSVGTETLLTFFGILSLYAIINSKENKHWFFVSAFFSGCAMAVKYTGLLVSAGVMAVYFRMEKKINLSLIKKIIVFVIIGSAIVSPWLIKNYIYRSNPVYPFMTNVFKVENKDIPGKIKGFMGETSQMSKFNFKQWLIHPWDITMGKIGNSSYFTPLFLFLLPVAFLLGAKKRNIVVSYFMLYFFAGWILWSFTSTMVRFLMPVYPAAAIIISCHINAYNYSRLKSLLRLFTILSVLSSCFWASLIFYIQGRWKVILGQISKEDFLSSTRSQYPYTHYPALQFINKELTEDSKTLIIGDGRSFYIKKKFEISSVFDLSPIVEYAKHSQNGKEMYERMRKDDISHLLLNLAEAVKLGKDYKIFDWNDKSLAVFNDFWNNHVKEIFLKEETIPNRGMTLKNRVMVYELINSYKERGVRPPYNYMSNIIVGNSVK